MLRATTATTGIRRAGPPRTIIVPRALRSLVNLFGHRPLSHIGHSGGLALYKLALLGSGSLSSSVFSGRIFGALGARLRFRDGCFVLSSAQRRFQDAFYVF